MGVQENRSHILLPIVMDNAVIPTILQGMAYVKCDSKSEEDLYKTKQKIERVLRHRKYNVRKRNLTERHGRTSSMIILTLAIEMFAMLFVVLFYREQTFYMGYIDDKDIITITVGILSVML